MKPKLIIEKYVKPNCVQLMVRIEEEKQIKYLLNFFSRFIKNKKIRDILKSDLTDILKFDKKIFSSNHVKEKSFNIDYLITDEGSKENMAFIFFVIYCNKKDFKLVTDYQAEDFFEL